MRPEPPKRKTEIWTVVDAAESRLGAVSWWAPWRRYTFHPDGNTLYDAACLTRIAEFCAEQTQQRKKDRKQE